MMKIWERYFIREVMKTFLLLIFSFYALYVLIDYSSRMGVFKALGLTKNQLFYYYLYTFIMRVDILIPFALLIGTIKTVLAANVHRELVALLASGIRLKKILRPFILIGLFFTLLVYVNTEFVVPRARVDLQKMEELRFLNADRAVSGWVHSLVLKDRSILLYQSYDATSEQFFDVYWIRSLDDLYRIKYLTINPEPEAFLIDHLTRNSKGQLVQVATYERQIFPQIQFDENIADTLRPAHDQSLLQLWRQLHHEHIDKRAKIQTAFYLKMLMPWLCFLAVLAPLPYCIRFSRNPPQFFIYVLSMFGLVALYLLMNALSTMTQNQVADPFWALLLPMIAVGGSVYWRYVRLS